jgi:hypothetical protein
MTFYDFNDEPSCYFINDLLAILGCSLPMNLDNSHPFDSAVTHLFLDSMEFFQDSWWASSKLYLIRNLIFFC